VQNESNHSYEKVLCQSVAKTAICSILNIDHLILSNLFMGILNFEFFKKRNGEPANTGASAEEYAELDQKARDNKVKFASKMPGNEVQFDKDRVRTVSYKNNEGGISSYAGAVISHEGDFIMMSDETDATSTKDIHWGYVENVLTPEELSGPLEQAAA
jgi:hypothetical protein